MSNRIEKGRIIYIKSLKKYQNPLKNTLKRGIIRYDGKMRFT